ncbi:ABC transporter ATP-binding protein [Subtercola frigoramans]|uniref:ATP-binding cassette subfamily B protein n=1 Tax=Subtercola frigoramans TaxID=120298 RepID=A0ABS2L8C7_9MICO|nr:ABC transporter ATP-binding protein [Subtercola frigoramans]MBM7473352.1 ATP-binding cassette subfamily B protein [Subtercola frigoramans]
MSTADSRATAGASRASAASPRGRSRGSGRGRRDKDNGPRAKFTDLLPYLLEHKKVLALVIGLSILGAAASLAQPLLVSQVITQVTAGNPLNGLVWLLVILVVLSGLISGFQHYLLQRTGEGVVLSSRKQLVRRMLNLPIREFDTRRTGDLVSRVGSDTTLLRAVLTQGLVDALGGSLVFVGALIAMLIIDPVLLGLTVLVVGVSIVVVVLLSARIRVASRQAQEMVGDLAASVERAISAVRTVRAANATEREIKAVEKDAEGAWAMGIKVAKISALVVPVAGIAMQVAFLTVIGVGGYRVASGAITIASLVSFILFLFMMIMPLGQAFGAFTSVNSALGALGRIQEIITLPSEGEFDRKLAPLASNAEVSAAAFARAAASTPIAVEFDGVEFAYAESATPGDGAPDAQGVLSGPGTALLAAHGPVVMAAGEVDTGATSTATGARGEVPGPVRGEYPGGFPGIVSGDMPGDIPNEISGDASPEPASAASYLADSGARGGTGAGVGSPGTADPGIRNTTVLRGVSFSVPRGQRVALVGPSGAGKSTILALIERFYDPTSGVIRVGGTDIRQLDREALRAQIGYVEQDAPVLAGSIRSNLLLASPAATDEECVAVLTAVNLLEVLERSPEGLDAAVGEEGVMLSGGERQRLAIARALLAAPPILLLDESTSSLDGLNEQMLREAIDAVAENRTLIVIAHRLSTVVDSDVIIVLDHGSVVGVGTHSELVVSTPLYRELAKRQLLV